MYFDMESCEDLSISVNNDIHCKWSTFSEPLAQVNPMTWVLIKAIHMKIHIRLSVNALHIKIHIKLSIRNTCKSALHIQVHINTLHMSNITCEKTLHMTTCTTCMLICVYVIKLLHAPYVLYVAFMCNVLYMCVMCFVYVMYFCICILIWNPVKTLVSLCIIISIVNGPFLRTPCTGEPHDMGVSKHIAYAKTYKSAAYKNACKEHITSNNAHTHLTHKQHYI